MRLIEQDRDHSIDLRSIFFVHDPYPIRSDRPAISNKETFLQLKIILKYYLNLKYSDH